MSVVGFGHCDWEKNEIIFKQLNFMHKVQPGLKADFQSLHEAPRSSLRVMHEHFHPITMLNSSF